MMIEKIAESYRLTKSMKRTAQDLNISEVTVRKALVTVGVYKSPLVTRIAELRAAGMPPKDIASLLKCGASKVCALSPYTKGSYLDDNKSVNAERIKKCRERKRRAESAHLSEDRNG